MIFNPIRKRETSQEGGLAFVLREVFDQKRPMGNVADSDLSDVVYFWLAGLHQEAAPIIPRALEWLDMAIAGKEEDRFGESPDLHRFTLYQAKAMGQWMLNTQNDKANFEAALHGMDGYCQRGGVKVLGPDIFNYELQKFQPNEIRGIPLTKKEVLDSYGGALDDFMALAVQAEQYEAGIAKFESYCAATSPSLKKLLKPRELGYALCLHHARGQYTPSDLHAAGRKMLQARLEDDWLGRGQSMRAATWLKLVYWHADLSLTPLETILKAYDDMPQVARPAFV